MLPEAVKGRLGRHLEDVRAMHRADLADGGGRVVLPSALARKFPNAPTEWRWQFVFPAGRICRDPRYGPPSRYHLHESVIQKAVAEGARRTGLTKRVSCHTLRHHAECRIMPMTRCPSLSFNRVDAVGSLVNAA
jgi:integrase